MKLRSKIHRLKPTKPKHYLGLSGVFVAILGLAAVSIFFLPRARADASQIVTNPNDPVLKGYNIDQLPSPFTAQGLNSNIYMEIAQKGGPKDADGNPNGPQQLLEAPEAWTKVYFDPNRIQDATIGIFNNSYITGNRYPNNGKYDNDGVHPDYNSSADNVNGTNDIRFDFFVGVDRALPPVNGITLYDDIPCGGIPDSIPFNTEVSNQANFLKWLKVDVGQAVAQLKDAASRVGHCVNPDGTIPRTSKTNRIVIFVRATWTNPDNDQGRIAAFKVGGAYKNDGTVATVDYWANYRAATKPERIVGGEYVVQNRISSLNTTNDYNFDFAPDCSIPVGATDQTRYLKTEGLGTDPNFNFYTHPVLDEPVNHPGDITPTWDLYDKTTGQHLAHAAPNQADGGRAPDGAQLFNFSGPFSAKGFNFIGGHKYQWQFHNIVTRNGLILWFPYDGFPSRDPQGCGTFTQSIDLGAGYDKGVGITDFSAPGGATVAVNLVDHWQGTGSNPGPAPTSQTTLFTSPDNGVGVDKAFDVNNLSSAFRINYSSSGNTQVQNTFLGQRIKTQWSLPGLKANTPTEVHNNIRPDIYAYIKIKDDAPDGARYCFTATLAPHKNDDPNPVNSVPPKICMTINNSLRPTLNTQNGDVHAGSTCVANPSATGAQSITGPDVISSTLGSKGDYIVSAGGPINNFGSRGKADDNSLQLGLGGYYGSLCRPDIYTNISNGTSINNQTATVKDLTSAGVKPYDLSTLSNDPSIPSGSIVKVLSGSTLTGKATKRLTIFSEGNLKLVGGFVGSDDTARATAKNLPTVGIVADNISIEGSVTGIIAALYARSNIDTCAGVNIASGGAAALSACKNPLLVSGFAMARDFSFKRTAYNGPSTFGLKYTEFISLNAALYLSPPSGFTPATNVVYKGERPPLY